MAIFKALHGRLSQLALFAFAFLFLAALTAAWSIHAIKLKHDKLSQVELDNLALLDELTQWGYDLVDAHQKISVTLADAASNKLDEAKIYLIHSKMVNDLARYAKKLDEITRHPQLNKVAANEVKDMTTHFGEYKNFMMMATDIVAIDPQRASAYIYQAQEQYIGFMNYEQIITAKLSNYMRQVNLEGSQSINEFFVRVMLQGVIAVIAIAGLAFLLLRMTTRKLMVVTDALTGISQHQEAPPVIPEIEQMAVRDEGQFKELALALLDFRSSIKTRQQAETQLRKLSLAVEQNPNIIIISGLDGTIEYANPAACKASGYALEDLIGQNMRLLRSSNNPEETLSAIRAALKERKSWRGEIISLRKNGEEYFVSALISPIIQPNGEITHFLDIKEDITEKKRIAAELENYRHDLERLVMERTAKLAEAEERWSFALEGSGDGVWDWNLQTGKVSLSKAGTAMFGYEEGEAGSNISFWYALLHPDDVQRWEEMLRNFFRSKANKFSLEYRVRCKDGNYKWILTRGMVVSHSYDGKVLRMIGVHTDTHQRKLAEERLELFRRIFDASERAIGIADGNGQMIYTNPAFGRMYGYSLEEIAGKHFSTFLTEGSLEKMQEFMEVTARGESWSGLLHQRRKDGSEFVSFNSIGALLDEQGKHRYLFNILYDYTPELARQEELSIARDRAEAANRSKSEFLSNMSHEIRTPMNAIIGLSNLCLQTELMPKQQDYLRKVHNSANSLLGIINDILDFSKIEAGKLNMETVTFELETVLDSMVTIIAGKAQEKDLEFLLEVSPGVPSRLEGDPLRLEQVLINLVGNAVKFTEKGEVLVLTELEEETTDEVVLRFTVKDTGIGMTEEQVSRLFQAFSQADATITRKFGGTGLGLSISKRLVEMMGGRIWVESAPGKGSKFFFTASFRKAAKPAEKCPAQPGVDLRGLSVLAVDDCEGARHILKAYLESYSFNVTMASSGVAALQLIREADSRKQPFDMVVADWKMPEMGGIELAQKLHELHELGKIPKVLLISSFGQSEMMKYLGHGIVNGVLAKPFQQSQLFNTVVGIFEGGESAGLRKMSQALFDSSLISKISGAYLLLVEDNEINQQVARGLLELAGVTVAIAENGKEALEQLQKERFDGVLMDMQMPVMDGVTATQAIRRLPKFSSLPIIAMTANAMGGDREACLAAGMNDYIAKPIDPGRMIETLAKWIVPAQPLARSAAPEEETVQKPETLPELPGVKVAEGVRRLGGNVESYYGILEKFRASQQDVIAEIRAALSGGDNATATRLVHTLKGLAGTLGASALQNMAGELESVTRKGEHDKAISILSPIEIELNRLFVAIDSTLRQYKKRTGDKADTAPAGPVNYQELAALVRKAITQLEDFDSEVGDSIAQLCQIASGDKTMKQAVDAIAHYIERYDYEHGLTELLTWARSLGISREKE